MAEPIIWTTAEDIEAERREVRRLRGEENVKWRRLRGLVANVRRWESRIRRLEAEFTAFARRGWVYLTGPERERYRTIRDRLLPIASVRLLYWSDQREAIIRELVLERETRFAEEDRLKRKRIKPPPPPPPKPIVAVVDSTTGHLIVYLDEPYIFKDKEWQVWLYDEEKKEYLDTVDYIRIEYTLSLETEGHEDLFAEVTGWTIIYATEMNHKHYIKDVTDRLIEKIEDWLLEQFTQYTREGEAVIPSFNIRPDFTIQEREHLAKVEGYIKTWMQTLEGWTQQPRILKRGIGYYTTDETEPHFTDARVYVEYSHAEEVPRKHVHKLPKIEDSALIDP